MDIDRTKWYKNPHGFSTNTTINDAIITNKTINEGMCWTDSDHYTHAEVESMARCYLDYYNEFTGGHFIWAAHVEIEAKWDYMRAWDMGWLNTTALPNETTHYKNLGKQ